MQPAEDPGGGVPGGASPGGFPCLYGVLTPRGPRSRATPHGPEAVDVDERGVMPPVSLPSREAHPGLRLRRKAARDAIPLPPVGENLLLAQHAEVFVVSDPSLRVLPSPEPSSGSYGGNSGRKQTAD